MKKFSTLIVAAILLLAGMYIPAQSAPDGNNNQGTDFWFSFPVCLVQFGGSGGLKIYVSCESAVQCTLEIPALGKKIVKTTNPNGIIEFALPPGEGQPYEKDYGITTAKTEEETYADGKGKGIHISAPVPVTVYGISAFNYSADSFLALPTSGLGKEYIVSSYADYTGNNNFQHLPSQTVIVAAHDNTLVSFTLGGKSGTRTVGGMAIGQTKSFKLNKGDVVAFATKKINGVYADLSGSKITASKPVAVTSGNQSAQVDIAQFSSDYLVEMELPTNTWGTEYHVTHFSKRKKYSFIKIFAKNPNTKLYRDGNPTPFAVLNTAGGSQGAGYYDGRLLSDGTEPRTITIKGDGPISVTQYNPGQSDDNVNSDPFQMVLTPVEQYQKEITFHPLEITGVSKEDYVNVVFEANADGSVPDDMEFGSLSNGQFVWKPFKSMFGATAEPIKGSQYHSKIVLLPGNGVFKIRALKPLAAYSYSSFFYASYGHPASVGLNDLTSSDDIAPAATYTQGCNGNILNGKITDRPNDFAIRSNISLVTLTEGSSNYLFERDDFVAGEATNVAWKLTVEDPLKEAQANIYFSDRAGNDTTITVKYSPPSVIVGVSTLDFGLLKTNTGKTLQLVLKNTSPTLTQSITKMSFQNSSSIFEFVTPLSLPTTLQPMEQKVYEVRFLSADEGSFKNNIIIEANDCTTFSVELTASAAYPLISATDADFGTSKINTEVLKETIVKNNGTVPLVITGYTSPILPEFTLYAWPTISEANPLTIQAGQEYHFVVKFTSPSEGTFTDKIVFKSDSKTTGVDSIGFLSAKAELTVGIEETQAASFTISPNPATGLATITLPSFKSQNVFLKLFDAAGNEALDLSSNLLKTELRFDTKALPNGAYFLRFTDGKTTLSRSFVIQN